MDGKLSLLDWLTNKTDDQLNFEISQKKTHTFSTSLGTRTIVSKINLRHLLTVWFLNL